MEQNSSSPQPENEQLLQNPTQVLADDIRASQISKEQSPLNEINQPIKQEIPSQPSCQEIPSTQEGINKINFLYFIGLNSLSLNLMAASYIFSRIEYKIIALLWVNFITYLALYQRAPIAQFIKKSVVASGKGLKVANTKIQSKKQIIKLTSKIIVILALGFLLFSMFQQIKQLEVNKNQSQCLTQGYQSQLNGQQYQINQLNHQIEQLQAQIINNRSVAYKKQQELSQQLKELEKIILVQNKEIKELKGQSKNSPTSDKKENVSPQNQSKQDNPQKQNKEEENIESPSSYRKVFQNHKAQEKDSFFFGFPTHKQNKGYFNK